MSYGGGSGSGPTPAQFAAWIEQHCAEDRGEIFHVIGKSMEACQYQPVVHNSNLESRLTCEDPGPVW